MKRIYLLLITLIVFSQTISAQNDRKLLKMLNNNSFIEFKYDEKGRIVNSVEYDADFPLTRNSEYTYSSDKVNQTFFEDTNANDKNIRTSVLENKKIIAEKILLSPHKEKSEDWKEFNYTYNPTGELIKVARTYNGHPYRKYNLTWEDGVITLVEFFRDEKKVGQIAYEYNKNINNKYLALIVNPISLIADYEGFSPYGQILAGYFGKILQHPVSAVHYTEFDERFFSWSSENDFTISYELDAKGIVRKGTQIGDGGATVTFTWEEDNPTGISVYKQQKEGTKTIYDLSGKRLENIQHGVNIITETNGKTHKVIVR